jgi:membrane protein implicated in regulation of membrane protease activity
MSEGSFLLALGSWGWFVAGGLMLAAEMFVPGTVLLWFGLAALVTGLLAFTVLPAWQMQLVAFAVLATASLFAWRHFSRGRDAGSDEALNKRAGRHVGLEFVLKEPIVSGVGRVPIDDSVWRVIGPDSPAGMRMRVVANEGAVLRVEQV